MKFFIIVFLVVAFNAFSHAQGVEEPLPKHPYAIVLGVDVDDESAVGFNAVYM